MFLLRTLPFSLPGWEIHEISVGGVSVIVTASPTCPTAVCPACHEVSSRVHSYYVRAPHDLPASGQNVQLQLRVRRFRCQNHKCQQQTFAERIPEVVACHAQRTTRLTTTLTLFAAVLSGQAGSRLLSKIGMSLSADTLLRLAKRASASLMVTPKVLGVDDFAFRRGHRYGTILVDLETHRPIDLLPERTADAFSAWLRKHPGVEWISRDRSTEYARGASEGAPQAQQIVDRWHLLKNVKEVLERLLGRLHAALEARQTASGVRVQARPKRRRTNSERAASQAARLRRQARYEEVVTCYMQGMSIIGIAEQFHMSRTTVRQFVAAGAFPERATTMRKKSLLDPYTSYLEQRVQDGCSNASQLWREIRDKGFQGRDKVVRQWLQGRREHPGRRSSEREMARHQAFSAPRGAPHSLQVQEPSQPLVVQMDTDPTIFLAEPLESPRHLVWLLLRDPSSLDTQEQQMLAFIRQEPDIEVAYALAQQFGVMVRQRQRDKLDPWITACLASHIPDLETFAAGLQKEYAAIKAALTLPYSNGPVEGQVNRLKFIKRSMYGRGGFELLRQRVLSAA